MSFQSQNQYQSLILSVLPMPIINIPPNTCAVRRLFLLSSVKRIKRIRFIGMFIGRDGHSQYMGNSHSGQQRFVTAAYRYIQVNGPTDIHSIVEYLRSNHSPSRSIHVRKASGLLGRHPMFIRAGSSKHSSGLHTYNVAVFDIMHEHIIVNELATKIGAGTSLLYSFKKYPAFIRNQVNAILEEEE